MEEFQKEKNQKSLKNLIWFLIFIIIFLLVKSTIQLLGLLSLYNYQTVSQNFNNFYFKLNFLPYIIINSLEILFFVFTLVSSVFVLKFKEVWRKYLTYSIITVIIFIIINPIVNFINLPFPSTKFMMADEEKMFSIVKTYMLIWSYVWSLIVSIFLGYFIWKLNRKEIKDLFN